MKEGRADEAHRHIPGLDGLRAVAIGCVLCAHSFEFGTTGPLGVAAGRMGTAGVHLFFAISGYLITSRLAAELAAYPPRPALKAFYVRRVWRILPPLLPYFALLIGCGMAGVLPVRPREVLAATFFASNYMQGKSWYTAHFWSLSAEEHFYLIWAPTLALLGPRRAQMTVVAIILLTLITRPILLAHSSLGQARALEQTHLQLDFFGYASLFALWMRAPRFHRAVTRLANHATIAVVLALLGMTAVRVRDIDTRTLAACLFGVVVLLLSANPRLGLTRALEHPMLTWIGKRSYGIYVWQQLIFVPIAATFAWQSVRLLPHLAIVLAIAGVSYRWLETPLLRKAQGWSRRILLRGEPVAPS
jgi:peptidoglycan/LPS O-acetylase OafA/YrhL